MLGLGLGLKLRLSVNIERKWFLYRSIFNPFSVRMDREKCRYTLKSPTQGTRNSASRSIGFNDLNVLKWQGPKRLFNRANLKTWEKTQKTWKKHSGCSSGTILSQWQCWELDRVACRNKFERLLKASQFRSGDKDILRYEPNILDPMPDVDTFPWKVFIFKESLLKQR